MFFRLLLGVGTVRGRVSFAVTTASITAGFTAAAVDALSALRGGFVSHFSVSTMLAGGRVVGGG